ncbi:MAG: hypothetical protein BK997_03290 [Candidatus Micrarchaeum sp. ARMAN-1]|nr:MAG: hypothetical protein BK997_03290 [Candidatus Micrarchaeum sp. ARMAN-1]
MVVLSYNLRTHEDQPSVISAVSSFNATNKYTFNKNLQVDADEIMLINGTWQRAYNAKVGDTLFNAITMQDVTITSINISSHGGKVYDFIGSPVNDYLANNFVIDKDSTCELATFLCSSFLGNESIELANGTYINVANVSAGSLVMGYNFQERKNVPTVIVSIKHVHSRGMYLINGKLELDGGESVILANGTNVPASSIKVGDMLYLEGHGNTTVQSVEFINETYGTYDINTAPTDDFAINGYVIS